jgi:hypothetical protein
MAYQSGLAGHAKPRSILVHPGISEASAPQDWFAFHNPFFAVTAGYDRAVAVEMNDDIIVGDLVGIGRAVFDRRQKLRFVHERAVEVCVSEAVGQKLIEGVDILIFFGQIPSALKRQNLGFVWAGICSILSRMKRPCNTKDETSEESGFHVSTPKGITVQDAPFVLRLSHFQQCDSRELGDGRSMIETSNIGNSDGANIALAVCPVAFDERQRVHHRAKPTARTECVGLGFRIQRTATGRELGRVECSAIGVKNPDVFVVTLIRI